MAYVPKMARVSSFASVASATSATSAVTAASAPAKKACEGVTLAPMRMIDLAKGGTAPTPSTPTAAGAKSAYVPPSMRIRAPAPPSRQLSFDDLASAELFPSLGTPTGTPISGGWTMAQIRSRLTAAAPTPKTVAPATPALSTVNSFAALDEEGTGSQGAATPRSTVSNFKLVIEERIKREEAERMGALIEDEPTDPKLMTPAQLAKHGWAALKLPPPSNAPAERRTWICEYNARAAAREAAVLFDESYGIPNYGAPLPLTLDFVAPVPDYPDDDMSVIDVAEEEYA